MNIFSGNFVKNSEFSAVFCLSNSIIVCVFLIYLICYVILLDWIRLDKSSVVSFISKLASE